MQANWDKQLTKTLTDLGIDWEKARIVVGIVAEERQIADRQGYHRGFDSGYEFAKNKEIRNEE